MARNTEKSMTALARWRAAFEDKGGADKNERRPYLATECDNVQKAEKWRRQIIGEVSRRVAQIQNAGLGEFKLRDLNDEINKLLREKGHWEDRILELGGPNYRKIGPKMLDHEGKEVPGNRGYKYFGAARDLPGVKELFEADPVKAPRKTRAELMKDIDADYYGYRDEDDGVLVPLEKEVELKVIQEKVLAWREAREADREAAGDDEELYEAAEPGADSDSDAEDRLTGSTPDPVEGAAPFIAHVPVPSQEEIEQALIRRKKMELLQKYAGDTLGHSAETSALMGV